MSYFRLFALYALLFPFALPAQINYDSVYQEVKRYQDEKRQIEFLDSLIDRASQDRVATYDSLYYLLIDLNKKSGDLDREIRNAASLAYHYYLTFEDQKAIQVLESYQDRLSDMISLVDKAYAYHKFGIVLRIVNRNQEALDYFNQAISQFEEVNDSTLENFGNALIEKAKILVAQGEFGEGSVALNRAKSIFEHNKDSAGMSVVHREQFILFSQIELYEEAQRYAELALNYVDDDTDGQDFFILTLNSARNLLLQERYEEAIAKYLSVQHINFDYGKLYLYNGVIEGLYFGNRKDSIAHYFQKLEEIFNKINRPKEFDFLRLQSRFLLYLSQSKFTLAQKDGDALMQHALSLNDVAELMMYNRFFADLYQQKGDYRRALDYSNAYIKARDSIQAANKSNALLLYQTQYETREKENQIDQLNLSNELLESRISRNRLLGVLLLSVVGILLLLGILFYNRMKIRELSRMQELRTNISSDLHDEVGSLLSGISMQADLINSLPDEKQIGNMLQEIGHNTRKAMTTMRDLVWSIDSRRDKVKDLKDKIAETCSKLLSPKHFEYHVDVNPSLNLETTLNPKVKKEIYLICKEAIHNIAKHSNGNTVHITIDESNKEMEVTIRDNGHPENDQGSTGQGLDNMQRRANQVGGKIKIEKSVDSFEVKCIVPV